MADFEVRPSMIKKYSSNQDKIANSLMRISGEINSCVVGLRGCISSSSYRYIQNSLSSISRKVENNAKNVYNMTNALNQISKQYVTTENKLKGTKIKGLSIGKFDFGSGLVNTVIKGNEGWIPSILGLTGTGAVIVGKVMATSKIFGFDSSGTAEGDILGGSIKTKSSAKWDPDKGDVGIEQSIEAEGHLASGKLKGNIGLLGGEIGGTVGSVGAIGKIGATLFKDGKFSPAIEAKLKAEAAAAKGDAQVKFGTDEHNAHIKGSGTLLGAEAEASGSAGLITYKDETTGQTKTELGVKGKIGAEAYLAQGKVSGGFTLFGIKIDAGVSGKAGGAGIGVEGKATTGGVSGKIGAGLGLGAGIEINIDWSNFSLW